VGVGIKATLIEGNQELPARVGYLLLVSLLLSADTGDIDFPSKSGANRPGVKRKGSCSRYQRYFIAWHMDAFKQ
jgi:hypothetical protein